MHIGKLLSSVQTKSDFSPKFETNSTKSGVTYTGSDIGLFIPHYIDILFKNVIYCFDWIPPHPLIFEWFTCVLTAACDHVCKAILEISNCVRSQQANVARLNLVDLFWKPLGIQLIGLLISHIRKQKITQEGYILNTTLQYFIRTWNLYKTRYTIVYYTLI